MFFIPKVLEVPHTHTQRFKEIKSSYISKTNFSFLYLIYMISMFIISENNNLVVQPCRGIREGNMQERLSNKRTGIQSVISLNIKQWTVS